MTESDYLRYLTIYVVTCRLVYVFGV